MSTKQDRQGARTATDLERKYQFGKTFAELMGIATDARNKADSVESSLRSEIKEQYTTIMRDTEEIILSALESYSKTSDLEEFEKTVQSELKIMADNITAKVTANENKITETEESLEEFKRTSSNELQLLEEEITAKITVNEESIKQVGDDFDKYKKDASTELQLLEDSITAKVTVNEQNITKVGNDLESYKKSAGSEIQQLEDQITANVQSTTDKFTKVEGDIKTVSDDLGEYKTASDAFQQAIEEDVDDAVARITAAEGDIESNMQATIQFQQETESELEVLTDRITMGVKSATDQIVEVSGTLSGVEDEIEEQFYAQESFKQETESELSLLSDQVSMNFQTHTEQITNINGEVQSISENLEKHFEFGTNGLIIKAGEGKMELVLDNDIIRFQKDGQEFGWWDGVNFHTGNIMIDVNERAQFGNFAFVPRSNGSLSFLKVGG